MFLVAMPHTDKKKSQNPAIKTYVGPLNLSQRMGSAARSESVKIFSRDAVSLLNYGPATVEKQLRLVVSNARQGDNENKTTLKVLHASESNRMVCATSSVCRKSVTTRHKENCFLSRSDGPYA